MKPTINAVILAGGFSRRMGTDKAGVLHPVSGEPLLTHQLDLIAKLSAGRVFVSARNDQELPPFSEDIGRINDAGEYGPLGGIAATLAEAPDHHLLVVPVDLPLLNQQVLERLITGIDSPESGTVAKSPEGLEPLVAIFPPPALSAMHHAIQQDHLGVKALILGPLKPLMKSVEFTDHAPFGNWNSPSDI